MLLRKEHIQKQMRNRTSQDVPKNNLNLYKYVSGMGYEADNDIRKDKWYNPRVTCFM